MPEELTDLGRPIRVVVFCGGPTLDPAVVRFVASLEAHDEIEFVGGFRQSSGESLAAVVRDRLKRRGPLGLGVLLVEGLGMGARFVADPRDRSGLRKSRTRIAARIRSVSDLHDDSVLQEVRGLEPDVGLIYGSPLLKPRLYQLPRLGTLGIHHGKMPQYRGKKTTFWSMYNGEQTAGVTIQLVNAGIDTGQIIRRGEVPIQRKSMAQVKHELEELGFTLYVQAILDLKRGVARLVAESGPRGKLYKDPKLRDFLRFWWRRHVPSR
jgi:folate-dependent phosphoribosylglycinamide formyltransferase PurN